MIKKLELDYEKHKDLIEYCKKYDIMFMSSACDLESIDLLYNLGMDIWKIPSGEITNLPYLKKIAKFKEKVL